jgi:hypothetical protein
MKVDEVLRSTGFRTLIRSGINIEGRLEELMCTANAFKGVKISEGTGIFIGTDPVDFIGTYKVTVSERR